MISNKNRFKILKMNKRKIMSRMLNSRLKLKILNSNKNKSRMNRVGMIDLLSKYLLNT